MCDQLGGAGEEVRPTCGAYACASAGENLPKGVRAYVVNYWDGMAPEAAAEKEEFAPLADRLKKVLEGKVSDVRLSHRLTDSPACLVSDEFGPSTHLERMLRE